MFEYAVCYCLTIYLTQTTNMVSLILSNPMCKKSHLPYKYAVHIVQFLFNRIQVLFINVASTFYFTDLNSLKVKYIIFLMTIKRTPQSPPLH